MKVCENVTMRVNSKMIEKLKTLACQRSLNTASNVTYTDLIREAIDEKYMIEVKGASNG